MTTLPTAGKPSGMASMARAKPYGRGWSTPSGSPELPQERHDHPAGPGLHRQAQHQILVRVLHVVLPFEAAQDVALVALRGGARRAVLRALPGRAKCELAARRRCGRFARRAGCFSIRVGVRGVSAHGEQLDALSVQADLDLVRRVQAANVVDVVGLQIDLEDVFAIDGKVVGEGGAAPRAERKVLAQAILLHQVDGDVVGLDDRLLRQSHGEPAHLPRRRQVALHQRRRDRQHARHVVECVSRRVGRQQLGYVDVERQQVADGVLVLPAAEAVERGAASRVGIGGGRLIERRFKLRDEGVERGLIGPWTTRWWHCAHPDLPDYLLPHLGSGAHVRRVDRVERQAAGPQPVVVAGDAVPIEQRPQRRGCRRVRTRGRLLRGSRVQRRPT